MEVKTEVLEKGDDPVENESGEAANLIKESLQIVEAKIDDLIEDRKRDALGRDHGVQILGEEEEGDEENKNGDQGVNQYGVQDFPDYPPAEVAENSIEQNKRPLLEDIVNKTENIQEKSSTPGIERDNEEPPKDHSGNNYKSEDPVIVRISDEDKYR